MKMSESGGTLTICLEGRLDAMRATATDSEVMAAVDRYHPTRVVLDCDKLTYISSAGLRIVVKLLKSVDDVAVHNAAPAVYDVFEMTGISEMMDVRRALRELSLEGCERIGQGGNGAVWRLDDETIIKVYNPGTSLEKIQDENSHATAAFVAGMPCAIAFDTVRVGECYGIVFEMINATTVGRAVHSDPSRIPELGRAMGELLRELHSTHMPSGKLPLMADKMAAWIDYLEETYLEHEDAELMRNVVAAIPERDTLLHLDYHEGNVMVQDGELVLIDLDDICVGNPLYDLINHYSSHILAAEQKPDFVTETLGMTMDEFYAMYRQTLATYFGTDDDTVIERHSQTMSLLMLFAVLVFLAKSKDSRNMSPETAEAIIATILPKFRMMAPQIIEVVSNYR